jgi:hypothetical protein
MHKQFANLLKKIEMAQRKDGQGTQRRKVSFHLFRDYVKTTISKHTTKDFSEWILGHSGSTYWNAEEDDTKELYRKCMKYLTYLDYDVVEVIGADYESKLTEMLDEIGQLKQEMNQYKDKILKIDEYEEKINEYEFNEVNNLEAITQMAKEIDELKKQRNKH